MNVKHGFDLEELIDRGDVSGLQVMIFTLCGLVAMVDGFDTQAIAFVAPEIITMWHVAAFAFGPVFGAGLFGGLIGALLFGAAGDRFGRKAVTSCAITLFAIASLLTPIAQNISALIAFRFITGIGLGGALPGFVSLTSEYSPKRLRSTLVGAMFCGFPFGAVLGGAASAILIPVFGWKSVFFAGGALPFFILPIFFIVVPESAKYLAIQGKGAAIIRILYRLNTVDDWNGDDARASSEHHSPVLSLFSDGRAAITFLLWITFFLSLLLTYFLINWIPLVARSNSLDVESAVISVSFLNLGAIVGCIALGRLADRFSPSVVIGCAYLIGALAIASIGLASFSPRLLYLMTFLAGAFSIGAQMCTVALCAMFYETFLRATGIGWAMGIGRTGAIAGPVLGGVLLGAGVSSHTLFLIAGATSAAAAITVLTLGYFMYRQSTRCFLAAPNPDQNHRSN
jgi:AAHS family 4-hydroxybenzoate transporter-like MFS transporter